MKLYMTQIELDIDKRKTRETFSNPNLIHGMVERSYVTKERRLWRIDQRNNKYYLLLISNTEGSFSKLVQEIGFEDNENSVQNKDYELFLANLSNEQTWRFKLKANTIKSLSQGKGNRSKIVPLLNPEDQLEWLYNKEEKIGVSFDRNATLVTSTYWEKFKKHNKHRITYKVAVFEGIITITDADKLRQVMKEGMGRQKAYGCGLLTLVRVM